MTFHENATVRSWRRCDGAMKQGELDHQSLQKAGHASSAPPRRSRGLATSLSTNLALDQYLLIYKARMSQRVWSGRLWVFRTTSHSARKPILR